MKKTVAVLFSVLTACVFAAEPSIHESEAKMSFDAKTLPSSSDKLRQNIFYVRFVASDPNVIKDYVVCPGFGVGFRQSMGRSAFDVFGSLSGRHGDRMLTWSFPKATYIYYLNPNDNQTVYLGSGMSFGGIQRAEIHRGVNNTYKDRSEFIGLMAHGTVGMELCRRDSCVVLTELSVTQPLIPAYRINGIPGPSAEVSLGLGF